jgi:hypothetical protein
MLIRTLAPGDLKQRKVCKDLSCHGDSSSTVTTETTTTEIATHEKSRNRAGSRSVGSGHGGYLGLHHAPADGILKIGNASPNFPCKMLPRC